MFWRRLSAVAIFSATAFFGLAAAGLTYWRGTTFLPLSVLAALLIVLAVLAGDTGGFRRSRYGRRTFTVFQVLALWAALLLNVLVIAYVLVMN